MPAAPDMQSLMDAAEAAASAGDYVTAEQQLRLAVELHEENAGPMHPDLANTLNNLGVIYERLERPADAERCYRRAFAIASAVLEPDHPFVTLSATNLRDFCLARNIPFEPAGAGSSASPADVPAAAVPDFPVAMGPDFSRAEQEFPLSPSPPKRAFGRFALAATLAVLAVVVIALVATRSRITGSPTAGPSAPVAPVPRPSGAEAPPPRLQADAAGEAKAPPPQERAAPDAPVAPVAPVVVSAELCRTLDTGGGDWRCSPASGVLQPGTIFFYTRVASPQDTTLEHRWYRNDRLHQAISLRVQANQRSGYRTYSRMTVRPDRAGAWRVELRTAEGATLREERFSVE